LRAFTERTIVGRKALAREVERVREQGWAQAVGEREDDLNAVAAPVHGARRDLAAVLGIQGPASRFDENAMARALEPLLTRAAAVSNALGWRPTAKEGL
jgi:DNA-binding IclR family transcriptional regulator